MKLVSYQNKEIAIWASKALIGPELELKSNVLLTIKQNKIKSIKSMAKGEIPENLSSTCVMLNNVTLMPGLIDAHLHLALSGLNFAKDLETWNQQEKLFARIQKDLENMTKRGIIAIRDGGDRNSFNLKIKDFFSQNQSSPLIISTGQALRKEDAYGSFLGSGVFSNKQIADFIAKIAATGANQLKVLISGIVSFKVFGRVGTLQFSLDELKLIVKEAKKYGLKVMAHASSAKAVHLAILAGVDSIEHGYFLTETSIRLMVKKGIAWVPTLIPVAIQTTDNFKNHWNQDELTTITKTYQEQLEKVKLGEKLGVKLGLGTDGGAAGVIHGESLLKEVGLYSKAGISKLSILKALTTINAQILGIDRRMGTVEIGKEPRLIGVLGNPLEDLNVLQHVKILLV